MSAAPALGGAAAGPGVPRSAGLQAARAAVRGGAALGSGVRSLRVGGTPPRHQVQCPVKSMARSALAAARSSSTAETQPPGSRPAAACATSRRTALRCRAKA